MRGLTKGLFIMGAITLLGATLSYLTGWTPVSQQIYLAAMGLLTMSLVVWLYGKIYWRLGRGRVWASRVRAASSGNSIRRQRRGHRDKLPAFLKPVGVNQGMRDTQPERVAEIEACDHPDFINPGGRRWDCVSCSLTVINDRKPRPGRRDIV